MTYASNSNAVLIDSCRRLQNLNVLLEVTEDVATTNGNGWSFQLNCYPPAGEYCQTSPLTWMQYIVYVQGGNLSYEIQYWATGQSTWPSGYTPQPGTTPWLPCWANDYYLSSPFASISGDTLPRQTTLQIALGTNEAGGVNKVTFTYTDRDGNAHSAEFDPPAVHPIVAFELNLVGPGGSANANFTQGITNSRGIIYYSISSGELSVQNGGAGSACGEAGVFTAETSNMSYSDISGAPGTTVTQILQQPVSCAVNNLFETHQTQIGKMQKIRDAQVLGHPAGKWLVEVLERHAADLAMLVTDKESPVARDARDLLTRATAVVSDKRTFDSDLVDDALRFLKRAACELPPTMNTVAPAASTLLESLRGRTLEDGLAVASKTIMPRFTAPKKPCGCCGDGLAARVANLEERVSRLEAP
ncbi:hypothetical protein [Arthrobacter sp. GMC3]|uniref:hypothetical protein n=1 Tax=Arthrobacter sp. GMC3 TaxID=2058894 RepID=UPI000CE329E8|nr:hypothetical protein [Arthrobacter sp. GMC3]